MADSVFSPDGKWMWTGEEWIPAPPNSIPDVVEIIDTKSNEEQLAIETLQRLKNEQEQIENYMKNLHYADESTIIIDELADDKKIATCQNCDIVLKIPSGYQGAFKCAKCNLLDKNSNTNITNQILSIPMLSSPELMIVPSKKRILNSDKNTIIVGAITLSVLVFIATISFFMFYPESEEIDDVSLTYFYAHTCDEVLVTWADGQGNIQQNTDYSEGNIIVQFSGKMEKGDTMSAVLIVSSWDDDYCAISTVYTVRINDGDYRELEKSGPTIVNKYEDVELSYSYIHETS